MFLRSHTCLGAIPNGYLRQAHATRLLPFRYVGEGNTTVALPLPQGLPAMRAVQH